MGNELSGRVLNGDCGGSTVFLSAGGEDAAVIKVWKDEIPENSCSGVEQQEALSQTYLCSKTCKNRRLLLHITLGIHWNWYSNYLLHIELGELDYLLKVNLIDKCLYRKTKNNNKKNQYFLSITLNFLKAYMF